MERARLVRISLAVGGAFIFIYIVVVPMFWSYLPVTAQAGIAAEWPYDQDMPIRLALRYWQGNTRITQVRYTILPEGYDDLGPHYYPVVVHQSPPKRTLARLGLSWIIFPRRTRIEVVVPFADLVQENRSQPGVYSGRLEVTVERVPNLVGEGWNIRLDESVLLIPFQITLR